MSGFEVAGIVLGSFPIIVGALELYIKGASTIQKWRIFNRRLKSLLNSVETEQVKLKNVYEKLLWDIAPPTQIEEMIDDPFGPLWKSPGMYVKVRQRLQRSLNVFERNVEELRDIVDEIKEKLEIQPDGKVEWADNTIVKRELKRIAFIFQSSDYLELLSRMRDGVSNLERLLIHDLKLEPNRQRLSEARLYKLVRNVSTSLYHALRLAVACRCPNLHEVALRLTPRYSTSTSVEKDDDIIKGLDFDVLLSHDSTTLEIGGGAWSRVKRWSELLVRPVVQPSQASEGRDSTLNSPAQSITKRKGVQFSDYTTRITPERRVVSSSSGIATTTTTSVIIQTLGAALVPLVMLTPEDIGDLCKLLPKLPKQRPDQCCGYITDSSIAENIRKYSIYPRDSPPDDGEWSVTSLRTILADVSGSAPPLLYGDRLRLAWTIASSTLQLNTTPWMSTILTLDEIFLIQRNNNPVYQDAIVIKRLPEPAIPAQTSPTAKMPTLFGLGILLIELILGETIETFRPETPFNQDYETVMKLLTRVSTIGGANYDSAVRRCIRCEYNFQPNPQREDDDSHTQVLMDIVDLLEKDVKNSGVNF